MKAIFSYSGFAIAGNFNLPSALGGMIPVLNRIVSTASSLPREELS